MWLLILNRKSGRGKVDRKLDQFIELCNLNNVDFEVIDEKSAEETSKKIGQKLSKSKVDKLVAFGGDGLVSICLQHVVSTTIGLSVVPTGTGNDFARSIGTYRKSVSKVFNSIWLGNSTAMDVAVVDNNQSKKYFIQVLSSGFDASVNELANTIDAPIGKLKYTLAMLFRLPRFRSINYEVVIDSQKFSFESMLVVVANGSNYGGGMKILPHASFFDGKLDLLYVDPVSKLTLLTIFPLVFKGWHLKHPAVHVISGQNIEIAGNTKSFADGEFVSDLPIKISVLRAGLLTWICK